MTPRIDAAALLREARAAAGLSQRQLADRAGTAQSVVARIETGEASPTVRTLNRLMEAAGASPEVSLRSGSPEGASPESAVGTRRGRDEIAAGVTAYFRSAATPGVVSAYLFGSTARNTGHSESDVDIAVLLDRRFHPGRADRSEARIRIISDLIRALAFDDVDVVVLDDAPPSWPPGSFWTASGCSARTWKRIIDSSGTRSYGGATSRPSSGACVGSS